MVETTVMVVPFSSTVISLPKLPTAPSTLMWSFKYLVYDDGSKTPFSVGAETSTVNFLAALAFLLVYYHVS